MSCVAWADPLVISTRPPDIVTTLSAPSTAAVLARHERLCVATYLLSIEATPDIPSVPLLESLRPRSDVRAGRKEWPSRRRARRIASVSGWPPSLAPQGVGA